MAFYKKENELLKNHTPLSFTELTKTTNNDQEKQYLKLFSKQIQRFYAKHFNGEEDFSVENYDDANRCLKTILKSYTKLTGKKSKKHT